MKKKIFRLAWLQILIGGLVLFALATGALSITGDLSYFPTVVLLGSFLVPVTWVTYFYEHVRDRDISMPLLTTCFVVGGILGVVAAGVVEFHTLQGMNVGGLLGVGVIEESGKMIFPLIMYFMWRYRHEADGLLFGIAAGMGFAALETMGYGLNAFMQSRGDLGALQQVLLMRGLLSPAGHAAWTGFVCAILWRQRERTGRILDPLVIGIFIVAIGLHFLWDVFNSFAIDSAGSLILFLTGTITVVIVSLTLVIRRFRESRGAALSE